jgi:hypothetical protein
MTRHYRATPPDPKRVVPGAGSDGPLDNMIACPQCGFLYDTRYLAEVCRRVEGEGYRCRSCNTLLMSV